ncbi:hypothetical protein PNC15_12985, partial [Enterococcus faecium]|nr:hypothetical protein [Enterococcus faecium]
MRKSSWEVLHAKAVEDKFEKSLETNSSRLVVRYVFVNGLVKRWRESLGDRQICLVSMPVSYTHL